MKIRHIIIVLLLIIFAMSCTPINEPEDGYPYAIYFLQNDNLIITDVMDKDLNSLRLESDPWLTSDDIDFYDWSSHCIYLKEDKGNFIPGWDTIQPFKMFPRDWADKPFVVTSNGQREYLGYFFSPAYSLELVPVPMFVDLGYNTACPSNILKFDWSWLYIENTLNNPRVKNALIEDNLLHSGIEVTLDSLNENTIIVLENSDTATISYTLTITNNDEDDLYILDPDITGSEIFHYFSYSIVFYNIDDDKEYKSWWKKSYQPPFTGYWSPEWFVKISSMESIQRTITLKGYPHFPPGEYLVQTAFSSPMNISKDELSRVDGRYWFGITLSNYYTWYYNGS